MAEKRLPALAEQSPVERIVVKFHEGTHVRLRYGKLLQLASERDVREQSRMAQHGLTAARLDADLDATHALVSRERIATGLSRLFQQDEAVLAEQRRSGEARSQQELADLDLYYSIAVRPGTTSAEAEALVAALTALESVETAYAQPPAEPAVVGGAAALALSSTLGAADIPPTTPIFQSEQGYLNAAPSGIDALYAWTVSGGTGLNVKIVDIEGGWRTTHEDMPTLFYMGGTQINDIGWAGATTAPRCWVRWWASPTAMG
jgi:hypothetical protein